MWYEENPILEKGEIGITYTRDGNDPIIKIGNGANKWNAMFGRPLFGKSVYYIYPPLELSQKQYIFNGEDYYRFSHDLFKLSDFGTYMNLMTDDVYNLPYIAFMLHPHTSKYISESIMFDYEFSNIDGIILGSHWINRLYFRNPVNANAEEIDYVEITLCFYDEMIDPTTGRADMIFFLGVDDTNKQKLEDLGLADDSDFTLSMHMVI